MSPRMRDQLHFRKNQTSQDITYRFKAVSRSFRLGRGSSAHFFDRSWPQTVHPTCTAFTMPRTTTTVVANVVAARAIRATCRPVSSLRTGMLFVAIAENSSCNSLRTTLRNRRKCAMQKILSNTTTTLFKCHCDTIELNEMNLLLGPHHLLLTPNPRRPQSITSQ